MEQDTDVVAPPSSNGEGKLLPEFIALVGSPRFSANQLRQIKAVSGLSLEQLQGEDLYQAVAYVQLRKAGYDVTWEQAGDMPVDFEEVVPDPQSTDSATTSPPSVGSGE